MERREGKDVMGVSGKEDNKNICGEKGDSGRGERDMENKKILVTLCKAREIK